MRKLSLVVAAAVVAALSCAVAVVSSSVLSLDDPAVRILATGYTWSENLHFDRAGNLFTTELSGGTVYRIDPDGAGGFSKTTWLHDNTFSALLGFASDPLADQMWVAGHNSSSNFVVLFTTDTPNQFKWLLTDMPKKGNGVGLCESTRELYVTSEGNFLPGDGSVYRVNITDGSWVEIPIKPSSFHAHNPLTQHALAAMFQRVQEHKPHVLEKLLHTRGANFVHDWKQQMSALVSGKKQAVNGITSLWGADGLWIDQQSNTLYVGELFTGQVWSYAIESRTGLGQAASIHGLTSVALLDDFTVSLDDQQLIGCNWWNKSIDITDMGSTSPSNAFPLLSGLNNPTSIRWGPPKSEYWSADSLFISEGSSILPWEHDCRILEIQNATQYFKRL